MHLWHSLGHWCRRPFGGAILRKEDSLQGHDTGSLWRGWEPTSGVAINEDSPKWEWIEAIYQNLLGQGS